MLMLTLNAGSSALFLFFNDTATTEIYTLSLHDALPIYLAVTAVNLGAATIKDAAGNAADLSGAVTNPAGTLASETGGPPVSSIVPSRTSISNDAGTLAAGSVVPLTVNLSEAVTVAAGKP